MTECMRTAKIFVLLLIISIGLLTIKYYGIPGKIEIKSAPNYQRYQNNQRGIIDPKYHKDHNDPKKKLFKYYERLYDKTFRRCGNSEKCLLKQRNRLDSMLVGGLIKFNASSGYEKNGYFPKELQVLNEEDLKRFADPMKAGNESTSVMEIVNPRQEYRVGDNVTLMVNVKDGYGKPTGHGGDQVRVWMVDTQRKAYLAAEVVDTGNGSYVAVLPLLWTGNVNIKASVTYNLMVQRAHYNVLNKLKVTRIYGAGFASSSANEATLCAPYPEILDYPELCNFTRKNGGLSWYCGKPKDKSLHCENWTASLDFPHLSPLPSNSVERTWWSWIYAKRGNTIGPLHRSIKLTVLDKLKEQSPKDEAKPQCNTVPHSSSWVSTAPRGYFMNNKWIPTKCSLSSLTLERVKTCLKDTTVLFNGDSNARNIFYEVTKRVGCDTPPEKGPHWRAPKSCLNKNSSTTIRWISQAYPFGTGPRNQRIESIHNQRAANLLVDELPDNGKFLLVFHLYTHLTASHDDVFREHIKALRYSIEKLQKRNPNVKAVIRGHHKFSYSNGFWTTPSGGDLVGPFYDRYIKNAFKGLEDSVFFLQPWDMVVAIEYKDIHPAEFVTVAMTDVILGHVCR